MTIRSGNPASAQTRWQRAENIDGRFCFDVEISLSFAGLVVAYKGMLKPVAGSAKPGGPSEAPCSASLGEEA